MKYLLVIMIAISIYLMMSIGSVIVGTLQMTKAIHESVQKIAEVQNKK